MCIKAWHELFQSSYKKFHSTETALLRVQSVILTALDNRKCLLLVMLDFDAVDHSVLLSKLNSIIGITGKALDWSQLSYH